MGNQFGDKEEKLFRAVRPSGDFWCDDGQVTSAVFQLRKNIHEKYVSVDRANGRSDSAVCDFMLRKLTGSIISIKVGQCSINGIHIDAFPTKENPFHSGIVYDDITNKKLMLEIAHKLAKCAVLEKK